MINYAGLKTSTGDPAGWFIKDDLDEWTRCSESDCKMWLENCGHSSSEVKEFLAATLKGPGTCQYPFR